MNIDLHTHSHCSDGKLSPAMLLDRAALAGVQALALTDHDTTAGLAEAAARAERLGIRFVPGVEISAGWRAQTLHVLGLWIDPAARELQAALAAQAARRRDRIAHICARLERAGLPGAELSRALDRLPGVPTRSHLAGEMVTLGLVAKPDEAFRKYLGAGGRAHVRVDWPALIEVIGWIRAAGGRAVLAHPVRYSLSGGARRALMADFSAAGGAALEVVSGPNGALHAEGIAAMAVKHGLCGSVGSDFHDPELAWNPLGRSLKLPAGITPVWRDYFR